MNGTPHLRNYANKSVDSKMRVVRLAETYEPYRKDQQPSVIHNAPVPKGDSSGVLCDR